MLYLVGKQTYKFKLPKKWKVHNMFHMSLLEQDTIKKRQVSKKVLKLGISDKNSKEYKIKSIWDSAVYANQSESGHLPGLYYLVA